MLDKILELSPTSLSTAKAPDQEPSQKTERVGGKFLGDSRPGAVVGSLNVVKRGP